MNNNISALIFAAGLGTRLYPLTADRPKALVEFQGKTLLEHVISKIVAADIHHIVINVHHFADLMVDFIAKHSFDADIEISDERDYLRDTGGGLKFAAPFFSKSEYILMHNVDILSELDLQALIDYHIDQKALATLAVRQRQTSRYFLFDEQMTLCGWQNTKSGEEIIAKPHENRQALAFSGIHIINKEFIDLIPSAEKQSITPIYVDAARQHLIKGFLHNEGKWKDMGKIEDFGETF